MRTRVTTPLMLAAAIGICASRVAALAQSPDGKHPKDPVIERVDAVHDAAPAYEPGVVRLADGELIAWWVTRGDFMPGTKAIFARSTDSGATWSEPYMAIEPDDPLTGCMAWLYPLPDGRLLLYTLDVVWPGQPGTPSMDPEYLSLAGGRKFDNYYSFSEDGGRTFTERKPLGGSENRNDFAQGYIVQLPSGDLLWPWGHWGSQPLNGFRRSTDGGATWGPAVRAWQDPPPGQDGPLGFNETAIAVCSSGAIVAIARVDRLVDKMFWQITSSDNGETWSSPRTIGIAGGSPAMYCTPDGQLWLAYRDAGIGPGLGLAVSDDGGDTWRFVYHLKHPRGVFDERFGHLRYTDEDRRQQWRPGEGLAGYPCFVRISDSHVYVVFHAQMIHQQLPRGTGRLGAVGNLLRIPE